MIVTIAGTVDNVGVTTLALETAKAVTRRILPKTSNIDASSVLLLEADKAGGVLHTELSHTTPAHRASLQKLLQLAPATFDDWIVKQAWSDKHLKNKLRCLFTDAHTAQSHRSLSANEEALATYLRKREDMITVVDAGRVLANRHLVKLADVVVWVMSVRHPASISRTKEMTQGVLLEGERRLGVTSGMQESFIGSVEKAVGFEVVCHLPDPQARLGHKPQKDYSESVERLVDSLLGISVERKPEKKPESKPDRKSKGLRLGLKRKKSENV